MSVNLMSLVFGCNVPELKTDDGKTVPDSTAKFILLSLADHANDEGEGAYPGVDKLCQKTNFSTATVCNALNALRHNGFTVLEGKSKRDTNNYTISVAKIREFQWLKSDDFSGYNPSVLAAKTNPSFKPSIKPSTGDSSKKQEKRGDLVDAMIELSQMPGMKKANVKLAIESIIKVRFGVNPSGKDWEDFITYAADRQMKDKQDMTAFANWALANGYDFRFWTARKLKEYWPRAFSPVAIETPEPAGIIW